MVVGYPPAVFECDFLARQALRIRPLRLPEHEAEVYDQMLMSSCRAEVGRLNRPENGLDFALDGAAGHFGSPHKLYGQDWHESPLSPRVRVEPPVIAPSGLQREHSRLQFSGMILYHAHSTRLKPG